MTLGRRFFAPFSPQADEFAISGEEFFHIVSVMRGKIGESIEVVNGAGAWCEAEIRRIASKSLVVRVARRKLEVKPGLHTVVAPSLSHSQNTNWMIEKLTEIGVDQVWPLLCERTEAGRSMSAAALVKKWQRIAGQSLKVSRRLWLTEVFPPAGLDEVISRGKACASRYFLDAVGEKRRAGGWIFPAVALVGPPGDFTANEKQRLQEAGFAGLKINEAILKTETAAVAIAAILKND